ncbi:hypothetical protein BS50DRAFT_283186 [Corynespora cassiicola Philippines]|uniref:Uncharacterized protein n=1 Tax=Corynespora cassiicola Philippines TaxID=1448308 RepID=A0A2T2P1B1_CORCC|nr:hypothetical protein BS50DRAFT_283186 [Corynespora cassiicola Philippines]
MIHEPDGGLYSDRYGSLRPQRPSFPPFSPPLLPGFIYTAIAFFPIPKKKQKKNTFAKRNATLRSDPIRPAQDMGYV